jgi:hypothetical protein
MSVENACFFHHSNACPMTSNTHRWRFFRVGGFDQVHLDTGADLVNLASLDQKLWVALSCPTQGVELDFATLALVDSDGDGHVRAPELIAAIDWAVGRLRSPDALIRAGELALADIRDDGEENARLLAAARRILASLGKADATHIGADDCADIDRIYAGMPFNGDGVISAKGLSHDLQAAIAVIIERLGAVDSRCGEPGVNRVMVDRFFEEGAALQAWRRDTRSLIGGLPAGAHAADAFAAMQAVREKIDDFFQRCHLATFDPRAASLLNGSEDDLKRIGAQLLSGGAGSQDVASLPLAYVRSGACLPMNEQVNPAWAAAVQALHDQVVRPLLGERAELSEGEWRALVARFADFEVWHGARPETALDQLEVDALVALLGGGAQTRLIELITQDEAAAEEVALIGEVERLVRYVRDLAKLARNFVAFTDFYTRRDKASFQAGTLYIDGRSSELCVKVLDAGKHAALATLSGVYLAYCECSRAGEKLTIAAAITAGDADQLMVGRNGVFYDRQGRDWDATIVKVIDHPISIRQAFWTPYKKVSRLIGEQVQKFAASKAQASTDFTTQAVAKAGDKVAVSAQASAGGASAAASPAPFDAAKFAGIFAAVGLAIGAIGTALAALITGFLGLKAWQMPLGLLGLMLLISGPSMAMAFFKLRNRNLGPILDANGWAVNTRARINIPFGAALTQLAKLPEGSERMVTDPYAEKRSPWRAYVLVAAIVVGVVLGVHWMGGWPGIFPPAP